MDDDNIFSLETYFFMKKVELIKDQIGREIYYNFLLE